MSKPQKRADKTICISFPDEIYYRSCMEDKDEFRRHLDYSYEQHPALFPSGFEQGYVLNGKVKSKKQQVELRRIKLKASLETYLVRPSFLLPYMTGRTDEVEKGLYLKRWGVPFAALAYVFGRNGMYWYRIYVGLGRYSLVGTTIKDGADLPLDLIADEKHTRLQGERVYLATTVAQECFLGAELAEQADTYHLRQAYGTFQQEAQELRPDYSPHTVNTDGWTATRNAWQLLFPTIQVILCFLHGFLAIRDSCRASQQTLQQIGEKVWAAYHAPTRRHFSQRIRRLRDWAQLKLAGPAKLKVIALCDKAPDYKIAFDHPSAYRTSNGLDRLMNIQDRLLYAMQYLHGQPYSAQLYVRAMALVWNFHPYHPQSQRKYHHTISSPAHGLNGFRFHHNWLHNLLISASLQRQDLRRLEFL